MKIIYQQDEKDCGVTCIAMVLSNYKTKIPIYKLREISGTDLHGVSALGIKETLELFGLICQIGQANNEVWQETDLPLPLIAHVISEQKYPHYVVVYKVKGNQLFIADPAKGKVKKSIEEFAKEWTGVLLLASPKESYQPSIEKVDGLSSFLPILLEQKALIFHIVLASFFITLFGIISSYYFQGLLDNVIPNQAKSTLNMISIGLLFVYLFRVVFEYSRSYILMVLGQRMSMSIMLNYFKHVLSLPLNFFASIILLASKKREIISPEVLVAKKLSGSESTCLK
ncbi:cysteine peptidase family C39 domain-containing protein [Lactococcus lactis]